MWKFWGLLLKIMLSVEELKFLRVYESFSQNDSSKLAKP